MSLIVALGFGIGAGLAYFGALWWAVAGLVHRPDWVLILRFTGVLRLLLLALGLAILSKQGAGSVLAALGGILVSRWYLIRRLGGIRHDE